VLAVLVAEALKFTVPPTSTELLGLGVSVTLVGVA
jgi:hypothetical protein